MHQFRSHTCGQLNTSNVGESVKLSGWVFRKRNHGQLLFIDLRDHYGVTQCVINSENSLFDLATELKFESVITVSGEIVRRSTDTINPKIPTGEIELQVVDFTLLSGADPLPFSINVEADYPEDLRLRYRFLDLRREDIHQNIVLRSKVITSLRDRMIRQGFTEFQTPILTASSPEGARDYLVPSRLHPGQFYALPQAPQQFKQLLMVAGFDRYFQIAPCFRDEASRADRSPGEFYQLDFEMSFVTQEDVFAAVEPVLAGVFEEFSNKKVTKPPFPQIPYSEAISFYGTDKPDLRNPIRMKDATKWFEDSNFKIFSQKIKSDPTTKVWAIPAPTGGNRAFCDRMNDWAIAEGQPGMGYIFFRDSQGVGPIANNIGPERTNGIRNDLALSDGDSVFFVCGKPSSFRSFAALARQKIASDLDLSAKGEFRFCWVTDFPMYELNEETGLIEFSHNPFSMPQGKLNALLNEDPLKIKAFQYDIVCNGVELSSGAIRNHRPDIMIKAFEIAGYKAEEVESRFAGMLNAFRYGAPPHGGAAPGIDRIVMLLADTPNIREIVAFPMNQQAQDLLMQAPAPISEARLKELHLRLDPPKKN